MRAQSAHRRIPLLLALILAANLSSADGHNPISLRTIEGEVVATGIVRGEGDLEVVVADLDTGDGPKEAVQILLAPSEVCEQIGFEVEEGDRIRVRIFVDGEGPARVQKIQNFSRDTMVRMRTLHATPLWSAGGAWQGGPVQMARGPHGRGRGSGRGPPG